MGVKTGLRDIILGLVMSAGLYACTSPQQLANRVSKVVPEEYIVIGIDTDLNGNFDMYGIYSKKNKLSKPDLKYFIYDYDENVVPDRLSYGEKKEYVYSLTEYPEDYKDVKEVINPHKKYTIAELTELIEQAKKNSN